MRKFLRFSLMSIFMLVSSFSYADAYKTLTFPDDAKNKDSQNNDPHCLFKPFRHMTAPL